MTTMWEARAAVGKLDDLIAWVLWRVEPSMQVYRTPSSDAQDDQRLVVIDPGGSVGTILAEVPSHLVAREPHQWDFEPVVQ